VRERSFGSDACLFGERVGLFSQHRARNPFPWRIQTIDLGQE
jgi:hypothetical protein